MNKRKLDLLEKRLTVSSNENVFIGKTDDDDNNNDNHDNDNEKEDEDSVTSTSTTPKKSKSTPSSIQKKKRFFTKEEDQIVGYTVVFKNQLKILKSKKS